MASLRQKNSKIPLRIDLKLKNESKIPLRVAKPTIPNILPSAELKSERNPTVSRNKKPTTEVKSIQKSNLTSKVLKERNRPTAEEKFKPIQVKEKENQICLFEKKIPAVKNDPFKTRVEKKQIKSSKESAQTLKDRNQPTTKAKSKHVIEKESENSFSLFEKNIPEINFVDDDPFQATVKETQTKNSKHPSQSLKDRNLLKTTKPKTGKETYKPPQVKNTENAFKKKIPEVNILEDDHFKTRAKDQQIKNSKHPLVVKERHLKTTKPKTAKEKCKPPRVKDAENAFEKKIPEINILDDDPFNTRSEETKMKNSNHPSQQNIEFVADDRMRKLILSNRELTPTILKSCASKARSSVMERLSLYKKINVSIDPHKQALEDLANHRLTSEGLRPSEMLRNGIYTSPLRMERPSLYRKPRLPIDPYKQALEDIAKYKLVSEGRRTSEMQKNRLFESPAQNRFSCYKRPKNIDPHQEALKSLAKLRIQRKVKSCKKKVTFNLCVEERSDSGCKTENPLEKQVETIQPERSKSPAIVNEKSSATSMLPSPELKERALLTQDTNSPKKVTLDLSPKTDQNYPILQINGMHLTEEKEPAFSINKTKHPESKEAAANNEKIFYNFSPVSNRKQEGDKIADAFNFGIKSSILKANVNTFLSSLKKSEVRQSLFSSQAKNFVDKANPKIFTPQPVSFYPRTELFESISPEFLSSRTTDILSCAPIKTPLVLRTLGRMELSPVCKKLEFKDSPKETKKESGDSRENSQTFYLHNIMTQQKILDQLTHQECSIFMHESTFPCETRGNLQNPVARILNDGDEMHFVPISLARFS